MQHNDWLLLAATTGLSGYFGYVLGLWQRGLPQSATRTAPKGAAPSPAPAAPQAAAATAACVAAPPRLHVPRRPISGAMAEIPAGSFELGGQQVSTDPYRIDIMPVTNQAYLAYLDDRGSSNTPQHLRNLRADMLQQPVVWVGFEDVQGFARWAGKRLPTAHEWLRAARGDDDGRRLPWGDRIHPQGRAVYGESRRSHPEPVAERGRTPHGCFDMLGNVWEWCADGKLRGGFWGTPELGIELELELLPGQKTGSTGFRLAADP